MKTMTLTQLVNFVKSGYIPCSQDDKNDVADILGHQAVNDLVLLLYNDATAENALNLFKAIMGEQEVRDLYQKAFEIRHAVCRRTERQSQISDWKANIEKAQKDIDTIDEKLASYGIVL